MISFCVLNLSPAMGQRPSPIPIFLQSQSIIHPIDEPATSVFLTFDDGPNTNATPDVAGVLEKYGAYGSFFAIGQNAESSRGKAILQDLRDAGHLIANHTFEHSLSYANESALEASLRLTTRILTPYLPDSGLVFFRSPGGVWNQSRTRWTNYSVAGGADLEFAAYVGPIFWNAGGSEVIRDGQVVDHADWLCWKKGVSVRNCANGYIRKIKSNYARGVPSVVLMHDLNPKTAEMLNLILFDLTVDPTAFQFKRLDMAIWPFAHQSQ